MASTVSGERRGSPPGRQVRLRTRETGPAAWRNLRPLAVVTATQMARIDRLAQSDWSLPGAVLMENAGANAYAAVRAHLWGGVSAHGPLVFVAGRGNNGGDAFVMARHAHVAGADEVLVALAGGEPRAGGTAAANLAACRALRIPIVAGSAARGALQRAAWIFDGITGTGLRSSLAPPLAAVVERINAASGSVVAIDVPSGLREGYAGGPLVRAAATVTIGLPKRCLYLPRVRTAVGEILVAAAGFPPALLTDPAIGCHLLTGDLLPRLLPAAQPDAHKGTRGHVAVFAGAPGTTGAAHLAGGAAARSGAGLVTLASVEPACAVTAALAPAATFVPLPASTDGQMIATAEEVAGSVARPTALLLGPGLGRSDAGDSLVFGLLDALADTPTVIDADGLNALADRPERLDALGPETVLTPHPGELARLGRLPAPPEGLPRLAAARDLAARTRATVVAKGSPTFVCAGERVWILARPNPALAAAGSGDVLAGVIASLLAQGLAATDAARLGVWVHSRAARIAGGDDDRGVAMEQVAAAVGAAVNLRRGKRRRGARRGFRRPRRRQSGAP